MFITYKYNVWYGGFMYGMYGMGGMPPDLFLLYICVKPLSHLIIFFVLPSSIF